MRSISIQPLLVDVDPMILVEKVLSHGRIYWPMSVVVETSIDNLIPQKGGAAYWGLNK